MGCDPVSDELIGKYLEKRIIWEKDGAEMVLIPEVVLRGKDPYDESGDHLMIKE